jgi:protein involved in polysaccharide export with SLBB domain
MTWLFQIINLIKRTEICIFATILILLINSNHSYLLAQKSSYKIFAEDLLEITFWESPEMDTQIRVNSDGFITLPVIGNLKVTDLTIKELSQEIITQMAIYNKLLNQVKIKVLEYGHNKVHITGQVASPGKYTFEKIPNLWDIIMEAGGPLEEAQLNEVLIVRNQEEGKIFNADVANALKQGEVSKLPEIYPGDAIHIPGSSSPYEKAISYSDKSEYYVLGAISNPGSQRFENNLNILDAIGRAGGPTSEANLSEVKYVSVYEKGSQVWKINLNLYLNNSLPMPIPIIKPGSTIFVPRKKTMSPIVYTIITTAITSSITALIFLNRR